MPLCSIGRYKVQDRFRFRVWDKQNNKWLHFDFSTYPTYQDRIWKALTDGETFYQCTGLKDRNGKLIYEGDIVKFSEHFVGDCVQQEHTEVIEFDLGSFNDELCNTGFYDGPNWCEVVGNIYEDEKERK